MPLIFNSLMTCWGRCPFLNGDAEVPARVSPSRYVYLTIDTPAIDLATDMKTKQNSILAVLFILAFVAILLTAAATPICVHI